MSALHSYAAVEPGPPDAGLTSDRQAGVGWQWLLGLTFLMLFVGNNVFRKPTLVILLFTYLPFSMTHLRLLGTTVYHSGALAAFWVVLVASLTWSLMWRVSLETVWVQTAFMALALMITTRHPQEGFSPALRGAAIAFVVLVSLYCLAFPVAAMSSIGLRAFLLHKNALGEMLGVSVLVLLNAPGRKCWHWVAALWAACLLALTQSKTSISLALICGFAWPIAVRWSRHMYPQREELTVKDVLRYLLFGGIICSLVLLVMFRESVLSYLWHELPNELLTGRGTLWRLVILQLQGRSLLGLGPGVFWHADGASEVAQTYLYVSQPDWVKNLVSADGSYADLLAAFGMLGVVVFLFTAVEIYRRIFRMYRLEDSRLLFVLTTFNLLEAVSSSTIMFSTNVQWLIYLLCYFRLATHAANSPTETIR